MQLAEGRGAKRLGHSLTKVRSCSRCGGETQQVMQQVVVVVEPGYRIICSRSCRPLSLFENEPTAPEEHADTTAREVTFLLCFNVRCCLLLRAQLTEPVRIAMATWAKVLGADAAAKR